MKKRPDRFLSEEYLSQDTSEASNYIVELHEYLWRFIKTQFPGAQGHMEEYLDLAIEKAEAQGEEEQCFFKRLIDLDKKEKKKVNN